jgi:predicted pyridoxine 5'-phosphate oxidase superfamily flavin-nucleotide-binding protein
MASEQFYTEAHRRIQERFDSRRLADRLGEITVSDHLDERARAMIEAAPFFFLATADADGWPDVSYKGGRPGFVRILDDRRLAFPSYDGNGMYRSLGNIVDNPKVGMLFIDLERPFRTRLKGRAELVDDPAMVASWPGAEAAVAVTVDAVFPNCSRYLHDLELHGISEYVPDRGHQPPEPEWKAMELFAPYLPNREPAG